MDEDNVIQASRVAVRDQRRMERESRRKAQEAIRTQKKISSTLGIKTDI